MIVERLELEPSSLEELGLREVKMTELGRFVGLTGKNGSGKSRVLRAAKDRIAAHQRDAPHRNAIDDAITQRRRAMRPTIEGAGAQEFLRELAQLEQRVQHLREIGLTGPTPSQLNFTATPATSLDNPENHAPSTRRNAVSNIKNARTVSSSYPLLWIATTHDEHFNLTHPDVGLRESTEAKSATDSWKQLSTVVEAMLGQPPTIEPRTHNIHLFGRPAHAAELSQGQNVLLQLAVALHAHSASLDNTVLFMDEPENHLHPSAVIDVLERLKNASGRMQFWIATHSVPLLAYLHAQDSKCLWYVEDGHVQRAGKLQQHVLESLLGNSERLEQLRTFVALPEQVAIEQFAAECLMPPGVSDKGKNDPQVQQIREVIDKLRADRKRPLEVLDYGAGRGRLLAGMFADNASDLRERISDRALDEYPSGEKDCRRVIESVYESSDGRYFSALDKFHNDRPAPVDLLVLCNVLHEMLPKDWQRRFGDENDFAQMLAPDGFLLVVEDHEIHVGEHAHEYGFLLLDTDELKALFAVEHSDIEAKRFIQSKHSERGDRLKAHWIAQPLVRRVTRGTILTALKRLQKRTREAIEKIRAQNRDNSDPKRTGQAHARAAMLFANASLALEALGE